MAPRPTWEFMRQPKYIRPTTFVNLKTGGLRPVTDTYPMAVLTFTLSPEAVGKIHDALICLGKFNESVSLEATRDHLVLTALNTTRTGYASFTFTTNKFFSKFIYNPPRTSGSTKGKFTCRLYNKALASIFKGRSIDPLREKDTGIERCEVSVEDGAGGVKSRFVAQMICRHGVIKTYQLTFESSSSMHALFKPEMSKSHWSIPSCVLREFIDHFGPKTEQLDIYAKDGRAIFTSYTEKIVAGKEVLKQPLHTSIAIDTTEFSQFNVEDMLHIIISVKDFKAIVQHAGSLDTEVSAAYSYPSKPMQLKYDDEGVTSEFILMTIGDYKATSAVPLPNAIMGNSTSAPSRQHTEDPPVANVVQQAEASMQPPSRSGAPPATLLGHRAWALRHSPPLPQPSIDSDSLFVPDDEEDRRWNPSGYGGEDEELLGWDAGTGTDGQLKASSRGPPRELPCS
ncbi:hypothetical protein GMDG_02134 [Pseudogymnoascus destructans 20631-21]|uniref:DNA repair protein rad9 n=1 Tax=Pseudogymnoascus destructans (strain ATCC MYA-4855 / 20631-21) TaxID=658429 RepID=L8G120_PSED2|nr:hypothetical protein GMDG_02134 [Pseudogymnoascus destructans 20631-21]